jgi:hypothetical protein
MIVICTNNGYDVLPKLLDSIHRHGTDGHAVMVVDTGSTNDNAKNFFAGLHTVKYSFGRVISVQIDGGYETGAFVAAYRVTKDHQPDHKNLIFLQDSLEVTSDDWVKVFEQRLQHPLGAVAWVTWHPFFFCGQPEEELVRQKFGTDNLPEFGIFGSIFATTYDTMEEVEKAGYFEQLPQSKIDSCIMERAWSIAFHRLGIPVSAIAPNGYHVLVTGGEVPIMKKVFQRRP